MLSYIIELKPDGKGKDSFWIPATLGETAGDLKAKIYAERSIEIDAQRLVFKGTQLEDSAKISTVVKDAGEKQTARIHFELEFEGGGTSGVSYGGFLKL